MAYLLRRSVALSELCGQLDLSHQGTDVEILSVSPSDKAEAGSLIFSRQMSGVPLGAIPILPYGYEMADSSLPHIKSQNIRMDFIRCLDFLDREIGFSHFDFESEIAPSVKIGNNVVVEKGCHISDGVILEHNVVIHSGTSIGPGTRIRANSSIGGDGFGFEREESGLPVRFPHVGGVIIGSDVEIGSNTCIARGTLSDTVIEDNVKIDNLVHISHNCRIKEGAFLIACSEISGGVVIGRNAWVGPNVSVIQKLEIGEGVLLGIGSVVLKDVPPRTIYAGSPAKKIRDL